MYWPFVGLVGTVKDVFMTSDSEGALMSAGGRWNIIGALNSVLDDKVCVRVMFPFGTALTVTVDAKMLAGVPTTPSSHNGISGVFHELIGMYAMAYYKDNIIMFQLSEKVGASS